MSTLVSSTRRTRRGFVPTSALAKSVAFEGDMMNVSLRDGRVLGVPLVWFPTLHEATPKQRAQYEIGGGGISLHWPALDEGLYIPDLCAEITYGKIAA